ncbi:MAG: tetratricopeptide repeat protein [Phycisphaerae bacterium]|jgi:tetratricopeptide (TPR) repeat protein
MSRQINEPGSRGGSVALHPGWGAWLAAGLGVLCFLNSLGNDFTYDDMPIVRDNPRTRSLANVREIWLSDWWQPQDAQDAVAHRHRDRLYRPLSMYSFAVNYAIGGRDPFGYHATNILLHAAACVLVWRLARRLVGDTTIATIAAVVFAVHPVHCEAVTSIVGRAEVLATLFLLGGLLVLLPEKRPPGWSHAAIAAVLFLAALFSKETAVCYVPVALLALHAAAKRPSSHARRWWLLHLVALLAPLVVYLPLRYVALDHHLLRDSAPYILMNPLILADGPHRLLHALTVLGHYTRLLIAPVHLSCNYGLAVIHPDRGPELMTFVGVLTLAAAVVALVGYRRSQQAWRWLAVLTAMSIASYALISNTVLLIGVSLAERLIYWPSVPMLLLLVVAVVHLWRHAVQRDWLSVDMARLLRVCGVLLVVALGLRSIVRNMDWKSNGYLFTRDVQTYPQSVELNEGAANELLWKVKSIYESGQQTDVRAALERADKYLAAALKIYPRSVSGLQLRGRTLGMLGERKLAMTYFDQASRLGPLDHVSRQLYASLSKEAAADAAELAALAEQVTTRPADVELRVAYAEALLKRGQSPEALPMLEEAVRLDPNHAAALRLLGETLVTMNESERAEEMLKRAAAADPTDWRTHLNLAVLLSAEHPEEALQHAQEAQRLEPDALDTNMTLAEALAINHRTTEALQILRRILPGIPAQSPLRPAIEARIRDLEQGRP